MRRLAGLTLLLVMTGGSAAALPPGRRPAPPARGTAVVGGPAAKPGASLGGPAAARGPAIGESPKPSAPRRRAPAPGPPGYAPKGL
jgi:hypothetical protein